MQIRRVRVCTVLRAFVSGLFLSMAIVPWVVTAALAGTFAFTGSMATARFNHTATSISNTKVLVAGGSGTSSTLASAEVYDVTTGLFTGTAGPMGTARESHTATLLNNGKVLIAGGWNSFTTTVFNTAELYDPNTNSFTATSGPMTTPRAFHTATLLRSEEHTSELQ